MKLYEYQAKAIFEKAGLPKPVGEVVLKPADLSKALKKVGKGPWAVKVQVLAGGRGKAGGVKLVKSPKDATAFVRQFLGKTLITHQTGPQGEKVVGILVEKSQPGIAREMYVSVVLDRKSGAPILIASQEGGMEIEALAKEKPDALLRIPIDPIDRLPAHRARLIAKDLGLSGKTILDGARFLSKLVDVFFETDANLVEVNPWVLTAEGALVALDGKITTDDNAMYRHADQNEWRALQPQSPAEERAAKAGLSYIKLDGNVGCLVNGAGLAMATMDIIKLHGGEPANFLDVGGGATKEQVTEAFKIILSDKRVEGILVNIFGGIMKCDVIANGILAAVKQVKLRVPLVVRLQGTNAEQGKKILADSKLPIKTASSLSEAAKLIVTEVGRS
jgi:succinyl-CoA synthetase beta subunit